MSEPPTTAPVPGKRRKTHHATKLVYVAPNKWHSRLGPAPLRLPSRIQEVDNKQLCLVEMRLVTLALSIQHCYNSYSVLRRMNGFGPERHFLRDESSLCNPLRNSQKRNISCNPRRRERQRDHGFGIPLCCESVTHSYWNKRVDGKTWRGIYRRTGAELIRRSSGWVNNETRVGFGEADELCMKMRYSNAVGLQIIVRVSHVTYRRT